MFVRKVPGAPWRERGGVVSRILLQEGDVPGAGIATTRVTAASDSRRHSHDPVARLAYLILGDRKGGGRTHG